MNGSLPPVPDGYERRMPRQAEARDLVAVGPDAFGRPCRLSPDAARSWLAMRSAADATGIRLLLISGFRGGGRQEQIVREKLEAGWSLEAILQSVAYPGHSEHHTGRAIDLGSPDCAHLTEGFEATREFGWLRERAREFGFHLSYPRSNPQGMAYEPWHWMWKTGSFDR
jgi:zinc D-Ala-D-Ala carboxypeptidase